MVLPTIDDVLQYCATLGTVASWNRTQHPQIIRIRMKEAIQLPTQRRNDNEPVKVFHALRCACPAIRLSIILNNLTAHVDNVCRSAPAEVKQRERALGRIRAKKSYYVRQNREYFLHPNDKMTQTATPFLNDRVGGTAVGSNLDFKKETSTSTQVLAEECIDEDDDIDKIDLNIIKSMTAHDSQNLDPVKSNGMSDKARSSSIAHEMIDLRAEIGLPRDEEIYFCQLLVSDNAPQVFKAHWTPTFCPMGVSGCDVSLERPVLRKRVFHSSLPPRFAVRRYVCHTHSGAFTALDPYMLTNLPDGVRLSRDVVVRGRSVATREFLSLLGVMWEDCGNVHTVRCNLMELWHRLLNECLGHLEVLSNQLHNAAPENRSLISVLPTEILLREEAKHLTEMTERTVHDLLQAWSEAPQSFIYSPLLPSEVSTTANPGSSSNLDGEYGVGSHRDHQQVTISTVMVTSSDDHITGVV